MLYDTNGSILDTSNFNFIDEDAIDEGACARIYKDKDNDMVIKTYKSSCKANYMLLRKTFEIIKELDLPSIVKLYNYYYDSNNKIIQHLMLPSGYTMEYIDNPKIILLDQNVEYLLDVMSKLEKDINILTDNKIKIGDAHEDNIIFQQNSAKLIDIDFFRKVNLTNKEKLLFHNKKELLYYIKSTIINELKRKNIFNYNFLFLFDFNSLSYMSVTDYLNTLLDKGNIQESILKKKIF